MKAQGEKNLPTCREPLKFFESEKLSEDKQSFADQQPRSPKRIHGYSSSQKKMSPPSTPTKVGGKREKRQTSAQKYYSKEQSETCKPETKAIRVNINS